MRDRNVRVALCDDHAMLRSGLRRILNDEDDLDVVGEAGTATDAIALARDIQPDVFVMDLGLPDASGIDATRQLREASPDTKILVLTVHDDLAYLRQAFAAGATGYLLKEAADVELVLAIHTVADGRPYVHPSLGAALLAPPADKRHLSGPGGELSERETEVLRLVALGHTNPEIAAELIVSVRTVESHRAHIQQKLDAHGRAELVERARDAGLLDDHE